MKLKQAFVLLCILSLVATTLSPMVIAQSTQQTTQNATGARVSLGNMGISSVGNMPVMSMVKGTVRDGSTQVVVTYSPAFPASGQPLSITLTFTDAKGNLIQHQNYALSVMQDGTEVFSNTTGHTHTGNDMQTTNNLPSSNPIDIRVTLNGVGLPGTDPSTWTGPKGDVLGFHVVPEFGPLASLVIAISIIGVIVISTRFRFVQKV
jgi:hypothetical protein